MQHSRTFTDEVGVEDRAEDPIQEAPVSLKVADRSFPPWAFGLGAMFTIAQQICFYSTALLGVFFVTLVAQQGEIAMVPVLAAIGFASMVCLAVVDFAHMRALAGYRQTREAHGKKISAIVSVSVFLVLSVIHPIAGGAILVGALIGGLAHAFLNRFSRAEARWEMLPTEAVSLLSGRDAIGVRLSQDTPTSHALARTLNLMAIGCSVTVAFAIGSYLIAENILTEAALFPLLLASIWGADNAVRFFASHFADRSAKVEESGYVLSTGQPAEEEEFGLMVRNLNVMAHDGTQKLDNLTFEAPPGSITGVLGESGAGKSLLLQALADPFALAGLEVSGQVRSNGQDLWRRVSKERGASVVYMPDRPILLPASGSDNLACFISEDALARGKTILERLVYSAEQVDAICNAPDATLLPRAQAQALAFARAVLIGPDIYLLDRPEDGFSDKQISSAADRLAQEAKLGRSIVIVTDNRALLDACDRLVVMQYGRIIDQGPAELVRERISTGWSRFIGARQLDTEENLTRWIHSHFRRGTEEANKRRVAMVATDMLTFSCKTADPGWPGLVTFSFKHFEGHCVLRIEDQDQPISSAQFERARQAAKETSIAKDILPLASIFQNSLEAEKGSHQDNRVLEVKIKTFDPRKVKAGAGNDAKSRS